jgi:hypothetical protein
MTVTHKALRNVKVADEAKGTVTAVFATLNVEDADGDVTLPGAFTDGAPVVISAYGHRSWSGDLPLGKGLIREEGDEAILEGQFFLDTTHGRDAFLTVKELSEAGLQEWSYSLHNVVSEAGEWDGRQVNLLKRIVVKEVSPVLRGSGVNTRTLTAKSDTITKFAEHTDAALCEVREFVAMAVDRLTERRAAGKSIDEQTSALDLLEAELDPLRTAIEPEPTTDELTAGTIEYLRAVRSHIHQENNR